MFYTLNEKTIILNSIKDVGDFLIVQADEDEEYLSSVRDSIAVDMSERDESGNEDYFNRDLYEAGVEFDL
jgi:hypothetical protein